MTPRLILLSRSDIQNRMEDLQRFLNIVPVDLAFALSTADADDAKKITPNVGVFLRPSAIVADFPASLIVNEDGTIEPLELPQEEQTEAPLVKLVE
jgi:hypothetical protein